MCKDMRDSSSSMKSAPSKQTTSMSASSEKDANNPSKNSDKSSTASKDCGCGEY